MRAFQRRSLNHLPGSTFASASLIASRRRSAQAIWRMKSISLLRSAKAASIFVWIVMVWSPVERCVAGASLMGPVSIQPG